MATDIRAQAAQYYDLNPEAPDDIPFYKGLIPSPGARVLELGCGTGRILLPLAAVCGYIHGLDVSEAMVAVCREKRKAVGIVATKAQIEVGDISNFALGRTFDVILAPYRVLQNLETDAAVAGLFECVRVSRMGRDRSWLSSLPRVANTGFARAELAVTALREW